MNLSKILKKYCSQNKDAYKKVLLHSVCVARKALEIAQKNGLGRKERKFIKEASLLHDIGVFLTYAPKINCFGERDYIEHGVMGRGILEKEGFPIHALVCERHIGVGITKKEIQEKELPLPLRDMTPQTKEEEIVCLADKFFSKKDSKKEKSVDDIKRELAQLGEKKVLIFENLLTKYKIEI